MGSVDGETSLQQFERIEKQVAGGAGEQQQQGGQQQNRNPLIDMSQNSADERRSTTTNQPSVYEVDDENEEDGGTDEALHLPPHDEFGTNQEEGSDLPVELSYQRALLMNNNNSASTGSGSNSSSRPQSGSNNGRRTTTAAQGGKKGENDGNGRRRSRSIGTMANNNGEEDQNGRGTGTTTVGSSTGETAATSAAIIAMDDEERERRKQEMIDHANAFLPLPRPSRNGGGGGDTVAGRPLFGASSPAASLFSTSATAGGSLSKTPSPLLSFSPLFQQRRPQRKSASTLEPLKVPNFKQAELHPPPPSIQQQQQQNAAFLQSTPHHHQAQQQQPKQQQQQKHAMAPLSTTAGKPKPCTPGGHQISPIAEERDLERLAAAVGEDGGDGEMDQRVVKSLIRQLRDLIAQWDWAQARHRHVAKIYFERQQEELNTRWEQLNTELGKFNEQKADEWAQIAKVRAGLHAERVKQMGKKDADRIKELEQEVSKLKSKEALGSQRASELRTRVRELEGEVQAREQSYNENIVKIKRLERQVVKAEQENSNLRTRITLMRADAQKQQLQQQQQQRGTLAPPPSLSSSLSSSSSTRQQQQQLPGPRATLFGLMSGNIGARNAAAAARTNGGQQQSGVRRNHSESTFTAQQQQHEQGQQIGVGRFHRSNSENGYGFQPQNGGGGRQQRTVRFAEPAMSPPAESAPPPTFTLFAQQQQQSDAAPTADDIGSALLNKRFDIPAGMMNTMYRITERGREYTFTGGGGGADRGDQQQQQQNGAVVVTELMKCRNNSNTNLLSQPQQQMTMMMSRRCLLYEWPAVRNFRWMSIVDQQNRRVQVQVDYRHSERLYEIQMPRGHVLRFGLDGQLELVWAGGDRTLVLPDGERHEHYNPEQPTNFRMEIFNPTGIAYRLDAQKQWQREQFVPDTARMSMRPDGSYVTEFVEDLGGGTGPPRVSAQLPRHSLQINSPDFQLRRFADTRAVKLALDKWAGVQLWLCTDNVLLVKHVESRGIAAADDGESRRLPPFAVMPSSSSSSSTASVAQKRICFAYGNCPHINIGGGSGI